MAARSPKLRVAAARAGALSLNLGSEHPAAIAARTERKAIAAAEYISRLVDEWPPLTAEQRDELATILRPAPGMLDEARRQGSAASHE